MSITTYNTTYHDDYVSSKNSDKNYLRVLFKPGYSVQVRELNQLQSALQDQINRLGSSVWKTDTAVVGGDASFLPELHSLTLNLSNGVISDAELDLTYDQIAASTKTISYFNNALRAEVVGYSKLEAEIYRFYIKYTNSGDLGETVFDATDSGYRLILRSSDSTLSEGDLPAVNGVAYISKGFASGLVCESGVFYTKGSFVAVPRQTFFIDKAALDTLISGYAVLKIDEQIISYFDDSTLLDNANGTPNYSAPGADRYTIDLSLNWITSEDYESSTNSYIKLLVINSSRPAEITETAEYAEIIDILAKRTSEESGNYTVNPFTINIRETFDGDNLPADCIVVGRRYRIQDIGSLSGTPTDWAAFGATAPIGVGSEFIAIKPPGTGIDNTTAFVNAINGGRVSEIKYIHGTYRADELDQAGYDISTTLKKREAIENARDRYTVTLDPSVAYVDGYRVSLDKSLNITSKKAREVIETRVNTSANIGSYFIGDIQKIAASNSVFPALSSVTHAYNLYATNPIATTGSPVNGKTYIETYTISGKKYTNRLFTANASTFNTSITIGGTPYTIVPYEAVAIGTCKIRAFEPTGGSSTQFRCFTHDIIFNTTAPTADWNTRRFDNIDLIDAYNFSFSVTSSGLLESTSNTALFQLPYSMASTMRETSFYAQKHFTGNCSSNDPIALSLDGERTFVDSSDVSIIVNGDVLIQGQHYTTSLSENALTLTITPNSNWTASSFTAISKIVVNNAGSIARVIKSKASTTDEELAINSSGIYTLKKTDIISIKSVKTSTTSLDITHLFTLFDDGQRDTIYTNGRIKYIGNSPMTEIFDVEYEYYERLSNINGRDLVMYNVDSYRQNNNSVGTAYEDIPSYNGIRLSDVLDFRQDVLYTVSNGTVGSVIANENKSQIDPNTVISSFITFYMPRIDTVTVNSKNEFNIINGVSSLTPVEPLAPKNSMVLYTLSVPAYTKDVSDIVKSYIDNRRYTMRDIGSIEKRISSIEYYTSLSLLERSAADKSIFDEAGERFKNGILVDNFIGHGVGNVFDPNYKCSIDRENGILRPRYNTNNLDLAIVNSANSNCTVHDSIITLNYEEVELVSHLKATANISVHPHIYAKISGSIRLSPAADNWKDTITRPDIIVNDDSAFDAIKFIAEDPSLDILGTDWNNWEREWGGTTVTRRAVSRRRGRGRQRGTATTRTRNFTETRTGTLTTLTASTIQKSLGTNVVDTSIIPFIRSRTVYFHATGLKGNTRIYPFFEDRDISAYTNQVIDNNSSKFIVPTAINDNSTRTFNNLLPADLPNVESGYTAYGSPLMTDSAGELYGSFIIPNNNSMRFRTGDRSFKLTDDPRNASSETTFAFSKYTASGILEYLQETILSTKTPQFNVTPLSETRSGSVTTTTTRYADPLAQSFVINPEDYPTGVFITSVDIYFSQKALFQSVEIYVVTMENGAPTRTILPYSKVVLNPDQVQVSTNGSAATNFKFTDPVFLKSDEEYSIIVSSNDADYRCWYAILGENDIATGKRIEKQEYLGTFFTSANAYTWTPQQEQDLKFRINRARFFNSGSTSASGNISFRTQLHTGIESIKIQTAGSNYTSPPTIAFTPDFGARAEAVIDPITGGITKINILSRGSGYTSTPIVSVTPVAGNTLATAANLIANLLEVPVSMYNLRQPNLIFNNTAINHSIQFGSESSDEIEVATNNYLPNSYGRLGSHILKSLNQGGLGGPVAVISANLITEDSSISPVIDVDGSSLLTITNIINNDSTDESYTLYASGSVTGGTITTLVDSAKSWVSSSLIGKRLKITSGTYSGKEYQITANVANTITFYPAIDNANANGVTYQILNAIDGGKATARYITRKVELNSPSDRLNVYISNNRPSSDTNIKVYVKLGFDTSTPDDRIEWQELSPTVPLPINTNEEVYSESEYVIDPNDDFVSFQVKIVLLSNNIFDIPTVRDFRAIATV